MTKKVLIFGSCVTRDAFSLPLVDAGKFEVVDYFARSSFASLALPMWVDESVLMQIKSPFQKKIVRRDMEKSFFKRLFALDFDFVVVDFIDDRFNIVGDLSGGATYSNEFRSGMRCSDDSLILSGSDVYLDLWNVGLEKFISAVKGLGIVDRIVLNKVFWAEKIDDLGVDFEKYLIKSKSSNNYLKSRYDVIERKLIGIKSISYSENLFVAKSSHKWGISPFHYVDDFYQKTIDCLISFD